MESDAFRGETKYLVDPDRVNDDEYETVCRTVTKAVLAVHPRPTAEIEVDASPFVLRAQESEIADAFERLLDAGLSISWITIFGYRIGQKSGLGYVRASSAAFEDLFTIFPYCYLLEFRDENGDPVVEFRERAYGCSFWLPSSKFPDVVERIDDRSQSLLVSVGDWLARSENETSEN